ncbi:hypothetical protein BD779DRAFT_236639 [Infundibulicybe gibba]|nr:hypothetical protein BD779DRAFT_236639 [Infundibulicybe gibba]
MTRDHKASETLPLVMAISRLPGDPHNETGVKRSFSCSQLEEKQRRDQDFSTEAEPIVMPDSIARPPDADLSTIIEAGTSSTSNQAPTPARSRSRSPVPPAHGTPVPVLSTPPASPITKLDPDASFNLSALDPDLAELLSPLLFQWTPLRRLLPSAWEFQPPRHRVTPPYGIPIAALQFDLLFPTYSTSFSPPTQIPVTPTHMNPTEPPTHSCLSPLSFGIPRPRPSLDSAIARPAYPRAHPSFEVSRPSTPPR